MPGISHYLANFSGFSQFLYSFKALINLFGPSAGPDGQSSNHLGLKRSLVLTFDIKLNNDFNLEMKILFKNDGQRLNF